MRKDGRSQRMSLANNLLANAADMGVAVHGAHNGRGGASRQGPYLTASCRRKATPVRKTPAGLWKLCDRSDARVAVASKT
jgi:hypothetical protein